MTNKYVYPAVFYYEEEYIDILFPDFPGCISHGKNDEDALRMAKEALSGHILCMEEDGDPLPEPTPLEQVKPVDNDCINRAVLIEVYMVGLRYVHEHPEKDLYPAVFFYEKGKIDILFPDFPGCVSQGKNKKEAMRMAKEALRLHICGLREDEYPLPEPTPLEQIKLKYYDNCRKSEAVLIEAYGIRKPQSKKF